MTMLSYSQSSRPLKIETPLGPDVLLLVAVQGFEAVSELFFFHLDLLAPSPSAVVFEELLGQPVSVALEPESLAPRHFHGIAKSVTQGRQDEQFVRFQIEMVPKFWLWSQRAQSRIFQQQSVPDILRQVLDGLDFELQLGDTFLPRNYCVQYRETDFDFASRLMQEEGISYFFQHTADADKLVLTDSTASLPEYADPGIVIYEELQGGLRSDERVTAWRKMQEVRSTSTVLWDHCFQLPGQNLQGESQLPASVQAGVVEHKLQPKDIELEIYDYPGQYAKRYDGTAPGGGERTEDTANIFHDNQRTARLRSEEQAARAVTIQGASNCADFSAGHKFTLANHFNGDGPYVLTRVEHAARLNVGYRSGDDADILIYENKFRCAPLELPLRPQRTTPRPTIAGIQTATVVGPDDAEIFCDKYGRVKVQFHWDRQGRKNGDSSCWLRVAQLWAGNRWGAFFWPRIGHEVVIAFLEGDPDRPLIVGSVYNAANMPPTDLPGEAKVAGIKSCIFGGDPAINFNALYFHDSPGAEYVQLHSEKHEVVNSENNKFHYVPAGEFNFQGSMF